MQIKPQNKEKILDDTYTGNYSVMFSTRYLEAVLNDSAHGSIEVGYQLPNHDLVSYFFDILIGK